MPYLIIVVEFNDGINGVINNTVKYKGELKCQ
jgi:hypothetical protein